MLGPPTRRVAVASGFMAVVRVTTDPTRQRRRNILSHLINAWHGTLERECQVSPGLHIYEPSAGFNRRTVEAMHDWTLANGLESELTYHRKPDGWEQRVRRPGESEPEFFNEMIAEPH
jgi:hypothetical protein